MSFTLRIRLVGPMQSWGTRSRFDLRDTERAPSKSGVIGLVAAALGRDRATNVRDLAALRFGVRTDRPGILMRDYHTAMNVIGSDLKRVQETAVTRRDYLADAAFLVGLEGSDQAFLQHLEAALCSPHWPLSLGRRSFPPSLPVAFCGSDDTVGIVDVPLEQALVECPPVTQDEVSESVTYHIEDALGDHEWYDQPMDDFRRRSFGPRRVRVVVALRGQAWS